MERTTLTEEKRELSFKLLELLAKKESVKVYNINIKSIIPIGKGLRVDYAVTTNKVQQWSRTIKYSDLANGF